MRRSLVHALLILSALVVSLGASAPGLASAGAGRGAEAAPLRLIVTGPDARGAVARAGGSVLRGLSFVGGVVARVPARRLDGLASDSGVSQVAADSDVARQDSGGDEGENGSVVSFASLDRVSRAWERGLQGTGVGIAVIDSGAVPSPALGSRLVQVRLPDQNGSLDDRVGHGTMVAGIAAGAGSYAPARGVAPRATVYAINVDRTGGLRSSDVIGALKWVFDNARNLNIRVVNLSLAETTPGSYRQSPLDLAVERLWAAGVLVVAAAGNAGSGNVNFAPANDPLVLTVGALDTKGNGDDADDSIMASFSASGVTFDGFAKPNLLAPGRLVASLLPPGTALAAGAPPANRVAPGYATISGTSFAAPQVAGAAAILFQRHPTWSPDQVKWVLLEEARDVDGTNVGALDVGDAARFDSAPRLANQGIPALVCAPGSLCLPDTGIGTVSSSWNSSSWNSSSWNSSSWNSSSWNSASWNSSSWNAIGWDSSSWSSYSWNSSSWNSSSWNSSSWNSSSWNSASWNLFGWD